MVKPRRRRRKGKTRVTLEYSPYRRNVDDFRPSTYLEASVVQIVSQSLSTTNGHREHPRQRRPPDGQGRRDTQQHVAPALLDTFPSTPFVAGRNGLIATIQNWAERRHSVSCAPPAIKLISHWMSDDSVFTNIVPPGFKWRDAST